MAVKLFPLDIALLGAFLFLDIPLLRKFNEMQTESSMEAASLTCPRSWKMQVDAVDGFGSWSVQ